MEGIKVAVRVRPFNRKEIAQKDPLCLEMVDDRKLKIFHKIKRLEQLFTVDHVHWSHDGFTEDPVTGLRSKSSESSKYADQLQVYSDLGVPALEAAMEGINSCLMTYGRTGSGKSYTMYGKDRNKGIVHLFCEDLFREIQQRQAANIKFQIAVSMFEIYKEEIFDLLADVKARPKGGLKIFEDAKNGVTIVKLSEIAVNSLAQLNSLIDRGNTNKTIAATQMNLNSSRGHTLIKFKVTQTQCEINGKPIAMKSSEIIFADLAGSEVNVNSQARAVEAVNINKSLTSFIRVVHMLAKVGRKKDVVPFRDSALTRVLKNALWNNCKSTIMMSLVPGLSNEQDSFNILRFSIVCRVLKTKPMVNTVLYADLVKQIDMEKIRLEALIKKREISENMKSVYQSEYNNLLKEEEKLHQEEQNQQNINPSIEMVEEIDEGAAEPQIVNLNEDEMLSGQIKYEITTAGQTLGRNGSNKIILKGIGIGPEHCKLQKIDNRCMVIPGSDPQYKTLLNGVLVQSSSELTHQDRLRFGINTYFVFIDPSISNILKCDYESAVTEASESELRLLLGEREEEFKRKEAEFQQKEFEIRLKMQDSDTPQKAADQIITDAVSLCNEANALAVTLGKIVRFETEYTVLQGQELTQESMNTRIRMMYPGLSDYYKIYLQIETLEARVPDMTDMYVQYSEGTPISEIEISYDPFGIDLPELQYMLDEACYLGKVHINTEPLINLVSQPEEPYSIVDPNGNEIGKLIVGLKIEVQGEEVSEKGYSDLNDVINKQINLTCSIIKAAGLPQNFNDGIYCTYQNPGMRIEVNQTVSIDGSANEFKYNNCYRFKANKWIVSELDKGFIINVYCSNNEAKAREINIIQREIEGILDEQRYGKKNNAPFTDSIKLSGNQRANLDYRNDDLMIERIRDLEETVKKYQGEIRVLEDRLSAVQNSRQKTACCAIF